MFGFLKKVAGATGRKLLGVGKVAAAIAAPIIRAKAKRDVERGVDKAADRIKKNLVVVFALALAPLLSSCGSELAAPALVSPPSTPPVIEIPLEAGEGFVVEELAFPGIDSLYVYIRGGDLVEISRVRVSVSFDSCEVDGPEIRCIGPGVFEGKVALPAGVGALSWAWILTVDGREYWPGGCYRIEILR